jgi:hypothetical protein
MLRCRRSSTAAPIQVTVCKAGFQTTISRKEPMMSLWASPASCVDLDEWRHPVSSVWHPVLRIVFARKIDSKFDRDQPLPWHPWTATDLPAHPICPRGPTTRLIDELPAAAIEAILSYSREQHRQDNPRDELGRAYKDVRAALLKYGEVVSLARGTDARAATVPWDHGHSSRGGGCIGSRTLKALPTPHP